MDIKSTVDLARAKSQGLKVSVKIDLTVPTIEIIGEILIFIFNQYLNYIKNKIWNYKVDIIAQNSNGIWNGEDVLVVEVLILIFN